jgi:uncharacterized protein YjbI with pentapeptide repeats
MPLPSSIRALALLSIASGLPLLTSLAQAKPETQRLAVLDVDFYGEHANSLEPGDPELAQVAGEALRKELARFTVFALVDSASTAAELRKTMPEGAPCLARSCAREIGMHLGAQWILTTRLSKTSNLIWYLFGQLYDVETGKLVTNQELELKGVASEMAPLGGRSLARRVAHALGVPDEVITATAPADTRPDAAQLKARLAAAGDTPLDLSGIDLSGLDLQGVDFRRATLVGARLAGSDLTGANLFSCDLTDAVLTGAKLAGANLDATTLRRADLRQANLEKASLFATIIEAADLSGANLSRTRIIGFLRKAKLAGANLQEANIGADPGNQSMGVMRTVFAGADLSGADLTGANLFKADLSHANLVNAKLARADLRNTDAVEADFTGADLTGADVTQADLTGAIFTRALGLRELKGLDQARNREKAIFDDHMD